MPFLLFSSRTSSMYLSSWLLIIYKFIEHFYFYARNFCFLYLPVLCLHSYLHDCELPDCVCWMNERTNEVYIFVHIINFKHVEQADSRGKQWHLSFFKNDAIFFSWWDWPLQADCLVECHKTPPSCKTSPMPVISQLKIYSFDLCLNSHYLYLSSPSTKEERFFIEPRAGSIKATETKQRNTGDLWEGPQAS